MVRVPFKIRCGFVVHVLVKHVIILDIILKKPCNLDLNIYFGILINVFVITLKTKNLRVF